MIGPCGNREPHRGHTTGAILPNADAPVGHLILCPGVGVLPADAFLVRVPRDVHTTLTALINRLVPEDRPESHRSPGARLVTEERHRQQDRWPADHDDEYAPDPPARRLGELVEMALWWADPDQSVADWPFLDEALQDGDDPPDREDHRRIDQLTRAAALIVAEIDRRLRAGERPAVVAAAHVQETDRG